MIDQTTLLTKTDLSTQTADKLIDIDINTIGELLLFDDSNFFDFPDFGESNLKEILNFKDGIRAIMYEN